MIFIQAEPVFLCDWLTIRADRRNGLPDPWFHRDQIDDRTTYIFYPNYNVDDEHHKAVMEDQVPYGLRWLREGAP